MPLPESASAESATLDCECRGAGSLAPQVCECRGAGSDDLVGAGWTVNGPGSAFRLSFNLQLALSVCECQGTGSDVLVGAGWAVNGPGSAFQLAARS